MITAEFSQSAQNSSEGRKVPPVVHLVVPGLEMLRYTE